MKQLTCYWIVSFPQNFTLSPDLLLRHFEKSGESAGMAYPTALCVGNQKFTWIEGDFNLSNFSGNGIYAVDSSFIKVNQTKFLNGTGSFSGIKFFSTKNSQIIGCYLFHLHYGLVLNEANADYNLIEELSVDTTYSAATAGNRLCGLRRQRHSAIFLLVM